MASAVIEHNTARKDKRLWTENPEGERAQVYRAWDENEEAAFVARAIRGLHDRASGLSRRGGLLPHQCPVARAGRRAPPRQHPLPDRGRGALLRAARGEGRGGLSAPRGEPPRRRRLSPSGGGAVARHRALHPRALDGAARRRGKGLLEACAEIPGGGRRQGPTGPRRVRPLDRAAGRLPGLPPRCPPSSTRCWRARAIATRSRPSAPPRPTPGWRTWRSSSRRRRSSSWRASWRGRRRRWKPSWIPSRWWPTPTSWIPRRRG